LLVIRLKKGKIKKKNGTGSLYPIAKGMALSIGEQFVQYIILFSDE